MPRSDGVQLHPDNLLSRPLTLSLVLMSLTIAGGISIRFARLGLAPFIVKYGGSMLWALMIYWFVSTILPSRRFMNIALLSGTLCTAVEFLKLYHSPALDAFRLTLLGVLLLGRTFSVWDLAAYWFAISGGTILDKVIRLGTRTK